MTRRIRVLVLVTVMALSVAGVAAATEAEGEPASEGVTETEAAEEEVAEDVVDSWFWYDEVAMQLIYWLPIDDSTEPPGCALAEPEGEGGEEATLVEEAEGELPECRVVDLIAHNGKLTHGSFVSGFVHSLKDDYDKATYGPKGQWVREIAQSDLGKPWADDDGEYVEAVGEEDETLEPRGNGKAKGKDKKGKRGNG
jgi:hypothetical protein